MSWTKLIFAIAAIAMISVGLWLGPRASRFMITHTTGSIFVSGPQVYTREQLVNDRYREDAWLLGELDNSNKWTFGATASLNRTSNYNVTLSGGTGIPAPTANNSKPASDAAKPLAPAVDVTPFERFRALLTYREQIRTLIIENQLDDRHDLRGNSLYRLRFDAAVLPGNNTDASAKVTVSVLPPDGLSESFTDLDNNKDLELKLATQTNISELKSNEQAVWERVYLRWLDSLGKRFEDGRKALRVAYDFRSVRTRRLRTPPKGRPPSRHLLACPVD